MSKNHVLISKVAVKAVRDLYDSFFFITSDNGSWEQESESVKHGRRVLERVKEELEEVGVFMRVYD